MYNSKEIRWFTQQEDPQLTAWFAAQGIEFQDTEPRTDFYLPLNQENMGIKLREGNIEIKHRIGEPVPGLLTESAEGYFENWTKWSFQADPSDKLTNAIFQEKKYGWTETWKKRIGVKIFLGPAGEPVICSIKDRLPSGCQVEYTQLKTTGGEYFTFALEWFGEEYIELPEGFMHKIMGETKLTKETSMGYGEFLKRIAASGSLG